MWWKLYTVIIVPVILAGWMSAQRVHGLGFSSFGKANTEPPKPAEPTAPPARQCFKQSECAGISGTSCVRTAWDPTTRCLCGDNQPPVNGQCEATQAKNLYHLCSNSDECNDGLVCLPPNITATTPHLRVYGNNEKICLCDTENGYKEKDHSCSDADIVKTSAIAVIFVFCLRKLLVY